MSNITDDDWNATLDEMERLQIVVQRLSSALVQAGVHPSFVAKMINDVEDVNV